MVPVYLLVGGLACLIMQLLPWLICNQSNGQPYLLCRILKTLLHIFCPIWLLTGKSDSKPGAKCDYEEMKIKG